VTDRPRLIGWSSLHRAHHRSLTSFVVIADTARRLQLPTRSFALRAPFGVRFALTRATKTTTMSSLAERHDDDRDAFRRVAIDQVSPAAEPGHAFVIEGVARARAPFSPWSRRCVRQHAVRRAPRLAPLRRFALRLIVRRDARCVGPTSAISRFSYQHPCLVNFRCVMRLRACAIGEIACLTSVRFASAGHTFFPVG
jgi:hypothetical protein